MRLRFRDLRTRQKLTVLMTLATAIGLLMTAAGLMLYAWVQGREAAQQDLRAVATIAANNVTAALAFGDADTAHEVLVALRAKPDIDTACLYAPADNGAAQAMAGYALAEAPPCPAQPGAVGVRVEHGRTVLVLDVLERGARLGWLRVTQNRSSQQRALGEQLRITAVILFVSLLLVLPLAWSMQQLFSAPLLRLAEVARRIADSRDYSLRAEKTGRDEVGQLVEDFNHMVHEVARRDRELRAIVDASVEGIVTLDDQGRIETLNPAAQQLFGRKPPEVSGQPLAALLAPPWTHDFNSVFATFAASIPRESRRALELVGRDARDVPFPLEITLVAWTDAEGPRFAALLRDLTERRRSEQLRVEKDAAEAASAAKGSFLATMSHEIRTPLNAIIGMTGLLMETPLNDEQREFTSTLHASGDHLLTVINDILDFSGLEAGKVQIEAQSFHLAGVVEDAIDLVAPVARKKNLELAFELRADVPERVIGDVGRVRQLLLNYLSNAVKFTAAGEVVVTLDATELADRRCELHFQVRDTGIGIPEAHFDRLFQSFSQVDASTTRRYGGSGLGLAICRKLAERMGGRVWAESQVGRGSVFHFTVVAGLDQRARRDTADPTLAGREVWVVDDNETNRRILRAQLESWGMHCHVTESPAQAIEWAAQDRRCDLALLDFHMPGMDGADLARELYRLRGDALPQVLLSSSGQTLSEAEAVACGVRAQLTKPARKSLLHTALLRVLSQDAREIWASSARSGSALPADLAQRHPLRVLVVEDNPANVKLILLLLERMGYRADVAGNGLEALAALRRQTYDLVLMDVQMPEMDGITAAREIRQHWAPARRPRVVALTAGVMPDEQQACLDAGMSAVLTKPLVAAQLVDVLCKCQPLGAIDEAADEQAHQDDGDVDLAQLRRVQQLHGVDATRAMIKTYADELPTRERETRAHFLGGDGAGLQRQAQTLASHCAMFGARSLVELCQRVEGLARGDAQALSSEDVRQMLARYRRLILSLQRHARA